jgi:hypothetical protein
MPFQADFNPENPFVSIGIFFRLKNDSKIIIFLLGTLEYGRRPDGHDELSPVRKIMRDCQAANAIIRIILAIGSAGSTTSRRDHLRFFM